MGSLFEIAKSGIQAYRQALSVTGQNIANINTEGYNKRRSDVLGRAALQRLPSKGTGTTTTTQVHFTRQDIPEYCIPDFSYSMSPLHSSSSPLQLRISLISVLSYSARGWSSLMLVPHARESM